MKILSLAFLLILLVACGQPDHLATALRCDDNSIGQLDIYFSDLKTKAFTKLHTADIAEVCETGQIDIKGYESGMDVKYVLSLENKAKYELVSSYFEDIHSNNSEDHIAYFNIIRIMEEEPYLANDRI